MNCAETEAEHRDDHHVNGINQRPTKRQITHNRDDKNSEQIQQASLKISKDSEIEGARA
jgi:hypothetical protein